MRVLRLTVAYDGTSSVGWQRQAEGRSIQGALEEALWHLDPACGPLHAAGRTDAGVHALAQVVSVRVQTAVHVDAVRRALNVRLPPDVRVMQVAEAADAFHARYDALAKTYRYRIWNGPVLPPVEHRYAWHVPQRLDVVAMQEAARLLQGTHDFAAFQSSGGDVTSTVRTVFSARLLAIEDTPLLCYEVRGDGFLRHMVRAMVGTLLEVGTGRRPAAWVADVIASRTRGRAGQTVPPHGLWLVSVEYPEDPAGTAPPV